MSLIMGVGGPEEGKDRNDETISAAIWQLPPLLDGEMIPFALLFLSRDAVQGGIHI